MNLRDYQETAVQFLACRKRGLVVAPAGSGKTVIAAAALVRVLLSKMRPRKVRIGWMANTTEQVAQAKAALRLFPAIKELATVTVKCAAADTDWSDCDVLIADECFPPDHLIGTTPISHIVAGQTVPSFNHKTNIVAPAKVLEVLKREYEGAWIRITTATGTQIICTENHPVFTEERGYIAAKQCFRQQALGNTMTVYEMPKLQSCHNQTEAPETFLQVLLLRLRRILSGKTLCLHPAGSDCVPGVRHSDHLPNAQTAPRSRAPGGGVLLEGLQEQVYGETQFRDHDQDERMVETCEFGANAPAQPDDGPGCPTTSVGGVKRKAVQRPRWQRQDAASSIDSVHCRTALHTSSSHDGARRKDKIGSAYLLQVTKLLQSGRCVPDVEIGGGNRRAKPQNIDREAKGRKKNGGFERTRVVGVEIYERGGHGRPSWVPKQNTVYNLHVEDNNNYFSNGILVHNCHHAAAPTWKAQIETCAGARWGFTATPNAEGDDAAERDAILRELFGDEWLEINRGDVGGNLTKAQVILLESSDPDAAERIDRRIQKNLNQWTYYARNKPDYEKVRQEIWPRAAWLGCVQAGIVEDEARNYAAVQAALRHTSAGESTIVLVNQVEHAKEIAAAIPGAVACYSAMGAKARRHALYAFKQGDCRCIVATSLADEGLDVPIASALVLISGGRNKAKSEQRTGRVLRTFAGKTSATIYDFRDEHHPLMKKHAQARQAVYRKLGYEFADEQLTPVAA